MKKISKITVKRIPDHDADTSWIGTFSNTPTKYAIKNDQTRTRNAYAYFNSTNATNRKEAQQDYDRMMQIENGNVSFYGVRAEAEILTRPDNAHASAGWKIDHITSGGLWGLESDAGEEYFKEEEKNQIQDLHDTLKEFGFTDKEISAAPVISEME